MGFYTKKFESEDFNPFNPNQLMIFNYSKGNAAQAVIKKMPNVSAYSGETSPKILSWNLSVILSKLLIEPSYDSEFFDENAKMLTEAIDEFSEEKNPEAEDLYALKELLDEMIKSIK